MKLKALICSLLVAATSTSAALESPPAPPPEMRYRLPAKYRVVRDFDICIVRMTGRFSCIRKQQMRDQLNDLSGRDRDLVTGLLDRVNASVGNSGADDMLVHCLGEWRGAKGRRQSFGAIVPGEREQQRGLKVQLTKARADSVRSTCGVAPPGGGARGNAGLSRSYGREAASVAQRFEGVFNECRKSGNSGVAQAIEGGWSPNYGSGGRNADAVVVGLVALDALAKWVRMVEQADRDRTEAALREAEKELADREPQERLEKQCLEADQCTEPETAVQMPLPPGGGGDDGMSCAASRASWNRFKDRCDLSSWNAYDCVAFVRMFSGCVDVRLIRPGPDGDLTCPVSQSDADRQALRDKARCDRLKLIGRPVPGGDLCGTRAPIDRPPPVGIDLCNDPNSMPVPGTCPLSRRKDP